MKLQNGHLVTLPNNEGGRLVIEILRQSLKGTSKRIELCGRGYRYGKGNYHKSDRIVNGQVVSRFDRSYQSRLPLSLSQKLAVYVTDRPTYRYKPVTTTKTEWVKVPTKWGKLSV